MNDLQKIARTDDRDTTDVYEASLLADQAARAAAAAGCAYIISRAGRGRWVVFV